MVYGRCGRGIDRGLVRCGMIETCSPFAIENLFTRVTRSPHRFRTFIVASPFIDDFGMKLLMDVDRTSLGFDVRVLTRPTTAAALLNASGWQRTSVCGIEGLHAKLYAALGVSSCEDEMVITSANLTAAGLRTNIEMGVRITGSRREYSTLVQQVVKWSTRRTFTASRPTARHIYSTSSEQ